MERLSFQAGSTARSSESIASEANSAPRACSQAHTWEPAQRCLSIPETCSSSIFGALIQSKNFGKSAGPYM
jgi:hypothetical protein